MINAHVKLQDIRPYNIQIPNLNEQCLDNHQTEWLQYMIPFGKIISKF